MNSVTRRLGGWLFGFSGLLLALATAQAGEKARVLPIQGDRIQLPEPVRFKAGTAELLPESLWVLDSAAATIETHAEIRKLEIGVHSDARGSAVFNKRRTQDKADRIRSYLIAKGVPADRLVAVGFGEERPIATNQTAEGRAKNRRVELSITERRPAGEK
ncbi:MAG: OmpA family protein [Deltaproteobacteria bacterium]|nr:OmpA family protein [Deltaproteobacteria bacterium]